MCAVSHAFSYSMVCIQQSEQVKRSTGHYYFARFNGVFNTLYLQFYCSLLFDNCAL